MKKIRLTAVFLLLTALLCACGTHAEIKATFPTIPEEQQKTVAFTCQNYDFDVYTFCSWQPGFIFYILSENYVDPAEISVSVPVDRPYYVNVYNLLENIDHYRMTTYSFLDGDEENGFAYPEDDSTINYQLYLYQASQGMDWKAAGEKGLQEKTLNDQWYALYKQGLADTPEAHTIQGAASQASREYRSIINTHLKEYRTLKPEDLPTFYMYQVEVFFEHMRGATDVSFREIEVALGGESYPVEIGEIRLRSDEVGNTYVDDEALKMYSSGTMDLFSYPYGVGIEKREGFVLRADDDVTLLSCTQLEGSICSAEILEIYLKVGGMDIVWDGETPIQIPKGKYIEFTFLIQDDRMKEVFYGENLYPTVTYEHNGEIFTLTSQLSLYRRNFEPWYWYAICFQELDLESYFNDYYYVAVDNWRKEFE